MSATGENDLGTRRIELADGSASLEVLPAYGGRINVLTLGGGKHNLIAGFSDLAQLEADRWFRNILLYPFANRMREGKYQWRGQEYQMPRNEDPPGNALHGFLFRLAADTVQSSSGADSATLKMLFNTDGEATGYPFAAQIGVEFSLSREALQVRYWVTNRAAVPAPVGLGWHPYFTLDAPVDELMLRMPPVAELITDSAGIITGETKPFGDFAELAQIGSRRMDTGFVLARAMEHAAVDLWSPAGKRGLRVWQQVQEQTMDYLQIFIPPDRRSIAIEPMSCANNAFNNGMGLQVVEPGQTYTTVFGVELLTERDQTGGQASRSQQS